MLNEEDLYRLVDFKGKTIIEFGPLEGGNSIILEKLEVKRVTVIEGHIENFVRCCVIKNLCELNRTTFYFDDVMNATVEKYGKYDMGFVAGILYHLNNPHIFLNQLSKMTDEIIVSTHYAEEKSPSSNADIKEICYKDFKYRGKLYKEAGGPNSGLQTFSFWPFREDLYNMLNDTGYRSINVINDLTDQGTNYKLIYLVAKKYD